MAFLTPDKTTTTSSGLKINEYLLTSHNPNKIDMPAKMTSSLIGVTLHNTDWISVASGTTPAEQYTRATVNGNMKDTRVHYYVDHVCAWRNLPDNYEGWHAATGVNHNTGAKGRGNVDTISIECIMKSQTDADSLASMENAAKLIAYIFTQKGWTVEKNLYTHNYWTNWKATGVCSSDLDKQNTTKVAVTTKCFYDSSTNANGSGKYCPVFILPQWEKFKTLVKKYMGGTSTSTGNGSSTSANTSATLKFEKNNIVQFNGGLVYGSSAATTPSNSTLTNTISKVKITNTAATAAHQYHCISEDGKGIYGWVDASTLTAITTSSSSTSTNTSSTTVGGNPLGVASRITSSYGPRSGGLPSPHTGIDLIATNGSAADVFARYEGTVTKVVNNVADSDTAKCVNGVWSYTGNNSCGNQVWFKDKNGNVIKYWHLKAGSIPSTIKVGSTVKPGTKLGTMGKTGWATGVHLHYQMESSNGSTFDPAPYYNTAGKELPTATTSTVNVNYIAQVISPPVNIRKGPGTNYDKTGQVINSGAYTIVQESTGVGATKWGKLKSGAGWVALDFFKKV